MLGHCRFRRMDTFFWEGHSVNLLFPSVKGSIKGKTLLSGGGGGGGEGGRGSLISGQEIFTLSAQESKQDVNLVH